MTRCLVIGGTSLLGRYLFLTKPESIHLYQTFYTCKLPNKDVENYPLDVRNKYKVNEIFDTVRPEIVIHCAENGRVDLVETNKEESFNINVGGTENIVLASGKQHAQLIYLSSNAVFSGTHPPYAEDAVPDPINYYGRLKVINENYIREHSLEYIIIRPFMLYGYPYFGGRDNWFTKIRCGLKFKDDVRLVNDTFWQPTYAGDVAQAIWSLLPYKNQIFNVASDQVVTLYEFGKIIAKILEYPNDKIIPIFSRELMALATRPVNSTFCLNKIHAVGIRCRGIDEGIRHCIIK